MKIEYKIIDKAIGMFLFAEVEALNHVPTDAINIGNNIRIRVSDYISRFYKGGFECLISSQKKHSKFYKVNDGICLDMISIETNPAHYQDELFIGLGIMMLNKFLNQKIKMPDFSFNRETRQFDFFD